MSRTCSTANITPAACGKPTLTKPLSGARIDKRAERYIMKVSDVFPSKYVAAADLEGRTLTLRIKKVTLEEMKDHDNKPIRKPVVWFHGTEKGFVLNVTNARTIAALWGDEMDDWVGKRIAIYPTQVRAFGKLQDCIRVREELPATPKPQAQAPQIEERVGLDDDEDVTDYEQHGGDYEGMWEPER